jgi:hypothetical protein
MKLPPTVVSYANLKNIRGRLTGKVRATLHDTQGEELLAEEGKGKAEAETALLVTILRIARALKKGSPTILTWRKSTVIIYPGGDGFWSYGFLRLRPEASDPYRLHISGSSGPYETFYEADRAARRHLAEAEWDWEEETSSILSNRKDQEAFTERALRDKKYKCLTNLGWNHDEANWLLDGLARHMIPLCRFEAMPPLPEWVKI